MKKNKEVIDIILPNYNSEKFISHTIRSIINQSYKYWKLIIVDDASNKKTKLILNKFSKLKKIKIYWLKKNKGAGHCRNYALKKSNSNFIAFIDSDDIWAKNKLRNQNLFIPHPRAKERDFVLLPLIDLDPFFRDPETQLTIKDLLKDLKDQYVIKKLSYRNLFQKIF